MSVEREQPPVSLPHNRRTGGWVIHRPGILATLYTWLPASMVVLYALWWLLRPSRLLMLPATPQGAVAAAVVLSLIALVLLLPETIALRMRHFLRRWLQGDIRAIGCLLLLVGALRLLHGDRMGWSLDQTGLLEAAQGLAATGMHSFFADYTDYAWLGHQHPPLAALYFGTAIRLFGFSQFTVAAAAFLITAGVVMSTYMVSKMLYDRWVGFAAAFLLLFIRSFLEHNVNMSNDMLLVLCFLLAVWGTLLLLRRATWWHLLGTGVAVGAGLLSKYTMVLFYGWLAAVALWVQFSRRSTPQRVDSRGLGAGNVHCSSRGSLLGPLLGSSWTQAAVVGAIGLLLFAPWVIFTIQNGALDRHVETVAHYTGIEQNPDGSTRVTLANEWHNDQRLRALWERWPAGFGFYNLPLLGVGIGTAVRRRRHSDLLVVLWIGAVMIPVFLLLPMWRYTMPAMPALALLMASGLREMPVAVRWRIALLSCLCTTSLIVFTLFA